MDDGGIRAALGHLRTLAAVRAAAALDDGELLRRFAEAHDEAAFTALVERHGPMVLRVCRRVLGHAQDAEDACQATFLVLVRKAASVRRRGSAASWLYGVAVRTARKLRAGRARREPGPGCRPEAVADTAGDDVSWREARAVLDEELLRLPEKYRAPLVLCYLEGRTRDEAARRLGLGLNRLRGRLDYGRGLLRRRLTRRGITPPALLLAALLVREAPAAVPALLVVSTVKAAALTAAGRAVPAGLVPARVVALTEGMVRTMLTAKLKGMGAALLLLAGFGVGLSAVWHQVPAAEPPAATPERPKGDAKADPPKKPVHPLNKALEGLVKHYALKDGEVLRSFRPPLPEERKAFFRTNDELSDHKGQLARLGLPPSDSDGDLVLYWKDGGLFFGWVSFAQPGKPPQGQALEFLLRSLAGIVPEEVEGDRDLRWKTLVQGDFVVRDGAAAAKVVPRLEEILNQEHHLPVKLTLAEADHTVYVLGGKYRFTPAAQGYAENHLALYTGDLPLDLPASAVPRRDWHSFPEFVQRLGRYVDHRVVLGNAEDLPAQVSWAEASHESFTPDSSWEAEHAVGPVLKRVTEQTGLTVREETRRVRVLTVERKK
jgi:RNA polymerase sigma factor (sigma-70 family)